MSARISVKSWCILLSVKEIVVVKMQQLMLGTGTTIWWVTEPEFTNATDYV